jgi:hypothetical protein
MNGASNPRLAVEWSEEINALATRRSRIFLGPPVIGVSKRGHKPAIVLLSLELGTAFLTASEKGTIFRVIPLPMLQCANKTGHSGYDISRRKGTMFPEAISRKALCSAHLTLFGRVPVEHRSDKPIVPLRRLS